MTDGEPASTIAQACAERGMSTGWFRVCLLLSSLWVGAVLTYAAYELFNQSAECQVVSNLREPFCLHWFWVWTEKLMNHDLTVDVFTFDPYGFQRLMPRTGIFFLALVVAPAGLWAFALALAWVMRGFREDR